MTILNTTRTRLVAGALVALAATGMAFTAPNESDAQPRIDWTRSSWWAACQQLGWPRPSGSVSTVESASVARSLADLRNPNSSAAELGLAERACRDDLLRDRRRNIPAHLCVGEANLMPLVQRAVSTANAQQAYCAYHSAAVLARGDRALLSRAHIGRAKALEALRASQEEVLDAYQQAVNANRNAAEARVALARYYIGRGGSRPSADDVLAARRLLVFDNAAQCTSGVVPCANTGGATEPRALTDLATAIVLLARTSDPADRGLLNAAQSAAPQSVAVNVELGKAYYRLGGAWLTDAERLLRNAISGSAQPDEQSYLPDAYYYLSLVVGRNNPGEAAELAQRAGPSDFRYQRQSCLMRLMQGGTAVYERYRVENTWVERPADQLPAYMACNSTGSTAEAHLLRGMFWLRHARVLADNNRETVHLFGRPANERFLAAVTQAQAAFRVGGAVVDDGRLGWEGQPDSTLRAALEYGARTADFYGRFCVGSVSANDPVMDRIFVNYRILRDSSALRCRGAD